jgi:hypothetical protein
MQDVLGLISDHTYIAGAILAAVAVLAYFTLKLVLKVITASLAIGAIAYVLLFIVDLTSTGMESTEKFRDQPKQTIDRL